VKFLFVSKLKNISENQKRCFSIVIIEFWIVYDSIFPLIVLNENQWLYLSTMMPQVLATLLGLSFAGYQFYGTLLQTMIERDESIKDSIDYGKEKIFHKLKFVFHITGINVICCVLSICFFDIENSGIIQIVDNILFNNSIFIFVYAVYYFIFLVLEIINPKFVEKNSDEGVNSENLVDSTNETISKEKDNLYQYGVFMKKFGELESIIKKESDKIIKSNKMNLPYRARNIPARIEIIKMYRGDLTGILNDIRQIVRFRNYLVHGTRKNVVTEGMNNRVQEVTEKLQGLLEKELN